MLSCRLESVGAHCGRDAPRGMTTFPALGTRGVSSDRARKALTAVSQRGQYVRSNLSPVVEPGEMLEQLLAGVLSNEHAEREAGAQRDPGSGDVHAGNLVQALPQFF